MKKLLIHQLSLTYFATRAVEAAAVKACDKGRME